MDAKLIEKIESTDLYNESNTLELISMFEIVEQKIEPIDIEIPLTKHLITKINVKRINIEYNLAVHFLTSIFRKHDSIVLNPIILLQASYPRDILRNDSTHTFVKKLFYTFIFSIAKKLINNNEVEEVLSSTGFYDIAKEILSNFFENVSINKSLSIRMLTSRQFFGVYAFEVGYEISRREMKLFVLNELSNSTRFVLSGVKFKLLKKFYGNYNYFADVHFEDRFVAFKNAITMSILTKCPFYSDVVDVVVITPKMRICEFNEPLPSSSEIEYRAEKYSRKIIRSLKEAILHVKTNIIDNLDKIGHLGYFIMFDESL